MISVSFENAMVSPVADLALISCKTATVSPERVLSGSAKNDCEWYPEDSSNFFVPEKSNFSALYASGMLTISSARIQ